MADDKILTMAFETSCDETSVAILRSGRIVLSNIVSSQIDVHKVFGGVVPEIASRHHLHNIGPVMDQALIEAGLTLDQIDVIGVTNGPGLAGALLIGVATAKAIAYAKDLPLVGVHHIQSHISANYLEHPELEPPFLTLVVSGGHTHLIRVEDYGHYRVLGRTRDDAAGEAFDKVARVLELGYPGGPAIDQAARRGNAASIPFKRVLLEKDSLDFSFSGLKTSVLNYVNNEKSRGNPVDSADVAAAFQEAVVDVLVEKATRALELTGDNKLALAGGVAANSRLREKLTAAAGDLGVRLFIPSLALCTDNAAMVACAAYHKYKAGQIDDWNLDAQADMELPMPVYT
jgi:N6-L-threonylcarbamoyladenine synthase